MAVFPHAFGGGVVFNTIGAAALPLAAPPR
jgi:hypothetical protein